jgi:two-component system alkaline phosphatase synthesis response regulator PhoP
MKAAAKILIIEDEELLAQMYEKKLTLEGFVCFIADNGDDGLKLAIEKKPDLILLDIMMPNKDGLSTLEDIRNIPELANVPVIMLTNLSENNYVTHAKSLGAKDYIVKSNMDPSGVVEKIRKFLK